MTRKSQLVNVLFYGAIAALFVVAGVRYVSGSTFMKGPDFMLVEPAQPQEAAGKIEVVEFFSYVCVHCHAFDPALKAWVAALPADVRFRRVPAVWKTGPTRPTAQLFFALQQIGELDRLHDEIFSAMHRDKVKLEDEAPRNAWLAKQGVAMGAFTQAWNSAEVRSKLAAAEQAAAAFKVENVPALAVAGKYVTSPEMARGYPESLRVADRLVAQGKAVRQ